MALHPMITTYLDGLDASIDGRGYGAKHDRARKFVEGACEMLSQLSRMDTPTDKARNAEHAEDIMADLDDERLCSDASALYALIRKARELSRTRKPRKKR
ncbi:hypothetical protein [Bradyrhizobium elkanii]|jgi:hypothetical protein|uniref:Succinate dehydrogenase/fumarate reductase flavoprotein subunit n=1 Tax=Bradyrhizobium elkanii TaxID=29448 RepID=A0ABV4F2I9_BRAEL|nr:hypothetical protein [Bradyrhizobium elkanii]MCS3890522.1 succinate dehydrogenase/fumarate reductase flavoprotein subunit [Bradyrhizobium elkanii]MCS4219878.1 succinate dehydrogenase/fumarate reductase flavoprotein subunit [Bradyrhizobium elkanii]WLB13711.1 hypothetical protein QIH87_22960 [Bradyrhizobium elkanii]